MNVADLSVFLAASSAIALTPGPGFVGLGVSLALAKRPT